VDSNRKKPASFFQRRTKFWHSHIFDGCILVGKLVLNFYFVRANLQNYTSQSDEQFVRK